MEQSQLVDALDGLDLSKLSLRTVPGKDLNVQYGRFLPKSLADTVFQYLEANLTYNPDELSRVKLFGKWHKIPRKQTAYGDSGQKYGFSGTSVPAKTWDPVLEKLNTLVSTICTTEFNFVLVNRYADGNDYIGEHQDGEKDLDGTAPIASVSLGQPRDFLLRHSSARSRKRKQSHQSSPIPNVCLSLEHGSLLLMNPPTNKHWYHSVPKRKRIVHPRINLTFRKLITNQP